MDENRFKDTISWSIFEPFILKFHLAYNYKQNIQ